KPRNISVYEFRTQVRFCSENPRTRLIVGSATLPMLASRMTMNWATATTASTAFGLTLEPLRPTAGAAAAGGGDGTGRAIPTHLTPVAARVHGGLGRPRRGSGGAWLAGCGLLFLARRVCARGYTGWGARSEIASSATVELAF